MVIDTPRWKYELNLIQSFQSIAVSVLPGVVYDSANSSCQIKQQHFITWTIAFRIPLDTQSERVQTVIDSQLHQLIKLFFQKTYQYCILDGQVKDSDLYFKIIVHKIIPVSQDYSLSKFNNWLETTILLPYGLDPWKITILRVVDRQLKK